MRSTHRKMSTAKRTTGLRFEHLEDRRLLTTLTRGVTQPNGAIDTNLVAMDMGSFLIYFDTRYGGAPLYVMNKAPNGAITSISDPFPGAGYQAVWNQGSSPTQATSNGPTFSQISTYATPGNVYDSFYGRETNWATTGTTATYQVTGFAPFFWWNAPTYDAIPSGGVNKWHTQYNSPPDLTDAFWFGCAAYPTGCVPLVYEGGSGQGVLGFGDENADYPFQPDNRKPWNERLQAIRDGYMAVRARVSIPPSVSNNASAALMFQRSIPTTGTVTDDQAAASAGYSLAVNKSGHVLLYRNGIVAQDFGVPIEAASTVQTDVGTLLEVRTIRNGSSDTFEIWVNKVRIGSYTDAAPIRGPHFALHAYADFGRIKFTDRDIYDLNTEFVATYTGHNDGHLESDITVRTTPGATSPTPMHFTNIPIGFLANHPLYNNTVGLIYDDGWNTVCNTDTATVVANFCRAAVLGGSTIEYPPGTAAYIGTPDGLNGYFGVPRLAQVNGQTAIRPTVALSNQVIGDKIRTIQMDTINSGFGVAPNPNVTSTRMKTDWWGKIPTLLGIRHGTAVEGSDLNVELIMNGFLNVPVTISYATSPVTATAGSDYTPVTGSVTIPAGQNTANVSIPIRSDNTSEPTESFDFVLTQVTNVGVLTNRRKIEITDVPPVSLSIGDAIIWENGINLTFPVQLSPASSQNVQVAYTTVDDSATAGLDYNARSGVLTIPAGSTSANIHVLAKEDDIFEANERFFVNLSNATGATISDGQAIGTIRNEDDVPAISFQGTASIQEGDSGTQNVEIIVNISNPSFQTVTVQYATSPLLATAGVDYLDTNGQLTFYSGQTSQSIFVAVVGDTIDEENETFAINLSNPQNSNIAIGSVQGIIIDQDPPPSLSISDVVVDREGHSGTSQALLTVSLSSPSAKPITVDYETIAGTAAVNSDFLYAQGSLSFAPGDVARTILIGVIGDTVSEPNETFQVRLSNQLQAVMGDNIGIVTVIDDDTPLVVTSIQVGSTDWAPQFRTYVDTTDSDFGYPIPFGPNQMAPLPWANIDQLQIRFSQDISNSFAAELFAVGGYRLANYQGQILSTTYDPFDYAVTITLDRPLADDRILLVASDLITSNTGNRLDGEWITGVSTQSGNGIEGGNFEFHFDVLPGDVNQSREIRANDGFASLRRQLRDIGSPDYLMFADIDGSGTIRSNDGFFSLSRQFSEKPVGTPLPPTIPIAALSDLAFALHDVEDHRDPFDEEILDQVIEALGSRDDVSLP